MMSVKTANAAIDVLSCLHKQNPKASPAELAEILELARTMFAAVKALVAVLK